MSVDFFWKPYVPVAERRRRAEREMERRRKKGQPVSPVRIDGRKIAKSFWGKAWCDNLERYSDYANRLPRGRTYVRNGSVVDLQVLRGEVVAAVSGSELYDVRVKVSSLAKARWRSVCADCAGSIDSLVELLQGRFAKGVMERVCQPSTGLFPEPKELSFTCSCPDWASMCKHVAAALYGVGARLDAEPQLLFALRDVDAHELVAGAGAGIAAGGRGPAAGKVLEGGDLSELFGIELDEPVASAVTVTAVKAAKAKVVKAKAAKAAKAVKAVKSAIRKPSAKKAPGRARRPRAT